MTSELPDRQHAMVPAERCKRGYHPGYITTMINDLKQSQQQPPVGLVAGWGRYPVEVARAIIRDQRSVCCIAITDHASKDLESICDHVKWAGVGRLGSHIRYFRRFGVREVTMAGKLFKSDLLFKGSLWLKQLPDLCAIRTFGPHLLGRHRDARDDSLLLAVTHAYSAGEMDVRAATDFAPELLVNRGVLAGKQPGQRMMRDIEFGWQIAKQMGGLDIGQSITVKDGTVIAVEAIEGTDACIERTGQLVSTWWLDTGQRSANRTRTCDSTCRRSVRRPCNAFPMAAGKPSSSKRTKRSSSNETERFNWREKQGSQSSRSKAASLPAVRRPRCRNLKPPRVPPSLQHDRDGCGPRRRPN